MNRNQFKDFLREWVKNDIISGGRIITEASEDATELLDVDGNDSLDKQVDDYLSQYQSEATEEATIQESRTYKSRRHLFEAGEDEDEMDSDESFEDEEVEKNKESLSKIDVASFASDVARLIENYDSLLEVKSTIARRAANFLSETYDEKVVMEFESVLREEHGISPNKSKWEIDAEDNAAPPAERTGGSSGGAG
jgi:hypothetical protein